MNNLSLNPKMLKIFLFLSLLISIQTPVFAAKLILSNEFNLIAINGKHASKLNNRKSNEFQIKQGLNRIALQYEVQWNDIHKNEIATIKSKVFIISFYLTKLENIRLTYLKPANLTTSRAFSKAPSISLIANNNFAINLRHTFPINQNIQSVIAKTKNKLTFSSQQKPIILGSKQPKKKNHKPKREN